MVSRKIGLIAALLAALPQIVAAQSMRQPDLSNDLAYCEQLFAVHQRYLLPRGFNGQFRNDARADLGIDLCRHQRTAEGIPILEGKLTRARFPLPSRG